MSCPHDHLIPEGDGDDFFSDWPIEARNHLASAVNHAIESNQAGVFTATEPALFVVPDAVLIAERMKRTDEDVDGVIASIFGEPVARIWRDDDAGADLFVVPEGFLEVLTLMEQRN